MDWIDLPAGLEWRSVDRGSPATSAGLLTLGRDALIRGETGPLRLAGLRRHLSLNRPPIYWTRPSVGGENLSALRRSQCLLVQFDAGDYGLLLPLIDGDLHADLDGATDQLTLRTRGAMPGNEPASARGLLAARGPEPFALIDAAMGFLAEELKTFSVRSRKRPPAFIERLGWCTWDAFRGTVDAAKTLDGLRHLRDGGGRVGFCILDDGWLSTSGDYLDDFPANRKKFPAGLSGLIDEAKRDFGIEHFGVWQTLQGYWAGLNPAGPLAGRFPTVANRGDIRPWDAGKPTNLGLVEPTHVGEFFGDWHDALRRQGVDFVKIDGQSATEIFSENVLPHGRTMAAFQRAIQSSAALNFHGGAAGGVGLLHCMAHSSDVLYNLLASNLWRSSDDYFPDKPDSHGNHLYENAMASVWASPVTWCDWDMFWSAHPQGSFHAAARAISGGPVYVSDKPGASDFELLRKLTTSDGRVLRADRPAVPSADCLFADPRVEGRLLKITNRVGGGAVIGLFNCHSAGGAVRDSFRPSDVHDLPAGERFAVYLHAAGRAVALGRDEPHAVELPPLGWEVASIAPIHDGPTPLGLLDKFNGLAAVESVRSDRDGSTVVTLRDGGRVGFFVDDAPRDVLIDGHSTPFTIASGLLTLDAPAGEPVSITLTRTARN